jgi:copper transport protein
MRLTARFLTLLAAALLLLSVLAGPASAHAILLRTEPAPQTTAARAPDKVRLFYSEPVEVSFGAVRVFDVNAHRVDAGGIQRAQGNREVVVPVRHLADGTYTVTWRVVSADGHPVHGGFGFYVVSPSAISAVAVPGEQGAGRVTGWGFGADRFLWFAAFLALIGTVVVRRWVWTPASVNGVEVASDVFRRMTRRVLVIAWVVLLVTCMASLVFEAASVSGLSLVSAARWPVLVDVLRTSFGRYVAWQLVLTMLLAVPVFALARRPQLLGVPPDGWIATGGGVAVGLSITSALGGHARTLGHPVLGVASLTLHLLAVSAWAGGLAALIVGGGLAWRHVDPPDRVRLVRALVPRFSRVATFAVAVVIATGIINGILDLASVSDLWRITYGKVLLSKIVLLCVALALASRHRWRVPRHLDAEGTTAVRSFQRSAGVELAALAGTVALAAALVALVPGRSLALAAQGAVNIERRAGGYTVQLFLDPSRVGANQVHVTFVNPEGLGAAEVTDAQATLTRPTGRSQAVDLRLISPGHFVGDVTLPSVGRYQVRVVAQTGATRLNVQTSFRLTARSGGS